MSFWDSLFGGGKSKVEDVKYPDYFNDPNFTDTQSFLNQYSKDLLTKGPTDYYKPIGDYGTPEFMNFLQQGNSRTLMGVNDQLAKTGRARGGQGGQIAAQVLGDKNAQLMYQDYVRAMQGRQDFFHTGLNTQAFVNNQGLNNQNTENKFNQSGVDFNMEQAIYGDQFDRQHSQDIGKTIGSLAPLAGAGIGFMIGGPAGASIGYGMGSSLGGGEGTTPQWLDAITKSKTPAATPDAAAGVSSIGRIGGGSMDPNELMKLFAGLH